MSCINYKHPDVAKIAGELNVSPVVAAAKIGVWQSKNNIEDRFPTVNELNQTEEIIENVEFNKVDFSDITDDSQPEMLVSKDEVKSNIIAMAIFFNFSFIVSPSFFY